jgi:hypothetical protein
MPLVCWNCGSSRSYAPENPPDIKTVTAPIAIIPSLALLR